MPPLNAVREQFLQQTQTAVAQFQQNPQPVAFFRRYAAAAETLLSALWQHLLADESLCLLATGGFGRGELYPFSDLDLAVVSSCPISDGQQEKIAQFVQILWDMKLMPSVKSGSVQELAQSCGEDITSDTAFLEARFLAGNPQPARDLQQQLAKQRDTAAFIEAKLLEMEQRHAKSQGSGAVLEPNIKSCPGSLRDVHTMLWIAKVQGLDTRPSPLISQGILTRTEAAKLTEAYKKLAKIRICLHLCAKRAEDRLIFDLQAQVAEYLGCIGNSVQRKSEQLMHIFYRAIKTVKQLHGILLPMLKGRVYSNPRRLTLRIDDDYIQINHQIAARNPEIFYHKPEHIFKIIELMQNRSDLTAIEPQTLRTWWGASQKMNRRFYENAANRTRFIGFFKHGTGLTHTLRFLNLYGVLGHYLPAWEKIVGLLQHDLFHIYPVDDHILTVVRNIRRLAIEAHSHELPFASSMMQVFEQKTVLYLAALFHDIAKGRGGDHAVQGIADARQFARDHFLNEEESDLLAWLVEHHLLMSAVAQKEDIQSPDVIAAFCRQVQTHERLAALYLLTVADIKGTNPKLWNSWRSTLLENLFHAAAHYLLSSRNSPHVLFSRRQQQAVDLLARAGVPEKQQKKLWNALGSAYFARHQQREILWHAANLVHDLETPIIRSRVLPKSGSLQVMVFMPNGPRLFARLCRIFSRHGFNIQAARAFVTEHNFILDTFLLQIPPHHSPDEGLNVQSALEAELNSFIHGFETDAQESRARIGRRSRYLPIAPSVLLTHEEDYPGWYSIDIVAVNRDFLLADVAEVFFKHDVRLRYAKISTLGERVEDSFMVYSEQLENPKNQFALKQDLLEQLAV